PHHPRLRRAHRPPQTLHVLACPSRHRLHRRRPKRPRPLDRPSRLRPRLARLPHRHRRRLLHHSHRRTDFSPGPLPPLPHRPEIPHHSPPPNPRRHLRLPFFGSAVRVPKWKLALAHTLNPVIPWLPFRTGLSADQMTSDPAMMQDVRTDPHVTPVATPR